MTTPIETCDECGFDAGQYGLRDALGTLRAAGPIWAHTTEGVADDVLRARPAPDRQSIGEEAADSTAVVTAVAQALGPLLDADSGVQALDRPDGSGDPAAVLAHLGAAFALLARLGATAKQTSDPRWERSATLDGVERDAAWLLRHAVHDATHRLSAVGRTLHDLGAGAPTQHGTVEQLNVSGGGVPKLPVLTADVGLRGLAGDRQKARKHHGRPWQALSLWSSEVIAALQEEGHPIHPGATGENITVAGIDWGTVRPGVRIRIGAVEAEVSAYATPCRKNAQWFVAGDINRMLHDRHPGWSRAYARVLTPGPVTTGDAVVVEP